MADIESDILSFHSHPHRNLNSTINYSILVKQKILLLLYIQIDILREIKLLSIVTPVSKAGLNCTTVPVWSQS